MAKAVTERKPAKQTIYQLRITLDGTDPPVWRRVLVAEDTTLDRLHRILQKAMGWEECHLHGFIVKGQHFGPRERETKRDSSHTLAQVLARRGSKFTYLYDMGDSWEHTITLEDKLAPDPSTRPPVCLDGARACPPEDCGGVWGYYGILEALDEPRNEEHEELLEWVGSDFDPEAFDLEKVNQGLAGLRSTRKTREDCAIPMVDIPD